MYSKQKEKIENLLSMFKISFADPIDLKNGKGVLVYSDETLDNTSMSLFYPITTKKGLLT